MRYHKEIKSSMDYYRDKIKGVARCNEDFKIATKLMPKGTYITVDWEVNVYFPVKSMDEVKAVLKRFAENGIMLDRFVESETNPCWYLKGSKVNIRLKPEFYKESEAEAQGATCRLVKIGEKTETYPQFKLVCDNK